MSRFIASLAAIAPGALLGWVAVTATWAGILTAVVGRLNEVAQDELPMLFAFWLGSYLPVLAPGLAPAVAFLALRPSLITFWRTVVVSMAGSATALLCLSAFVRWVPAVRLTRGLIIPMGVIGLVTLILAGIALMIAADVASRPAGAGRRLRLAGACATLGVLLLLGGHGIQRSYENPSRVDLLARVRPLIDPAAGCSPSIAPVRSIAILGLDGMTWNVLAPFIEQGRMPNLAGLLARSAYGHLETLKDSYSPAVWSTIATGVPVDDHFISGFMRFLIPGVSRPISRGPQLQAFMWWGGANYVLNAATRLGWIDSEPQSSTQRRMQSMWNVAAASGHTVGVYNWMTTWPVERMPGYMVTHSGKPPLDRYPPSLESDALLGEAQEFDQSQPFEMYRLRFAAAVSLLERFKPTFSMSFNKVLDDMHDWGVLQSKELVIMVPDSAPYSAFDPFVHRAYELSDEWIGRFIEAVPPDSVVVIVSDHGYEFNGTHHAFGPPGVVILSGGPFACGKVIEGATIFDIAPTVLSLLGAPALDGMPGEPLTDALASGGSLELERIAAYPEAWRESVSEEGDAGADWEQMRKRLEALGYVN